MSVLTSSIVGWLWVVVFIGVIMKKVQVCTERKSGDSDPSSMSAVEYTKGTDPFLQSFVDLYVDNMEVQVS